MKHFLLILLLAFLISGCEDVIDVDLPEQDPRLIVDALIKVDTTQSTTPVAIQVSTNDSFFNELKPAQLENIYLYFEQADGFIDLFELEEGSGIYQPSADEINPSEVATQLLMSEEQVLLSLRYEGDNYIAYASFVPTVPIDNIEQGNSTLFDEDETEIIVTYTDRAETEDYYLFNFGFRNYLVTEDTFYNGKQFEFSYFYDENLQPGDNLEIELMGVDKDFYDYMGLLIEQSGQDAGPFQTPVATVRGNIFNVTEIDNIDFYDNVDQPDNFALGYFAIVHTYRSSLTITE